jgi:hypothetical protein
MFLQRPNAGRHRGRSPRAALTTESSEASTTDSGSSERQGDSPGTEIESDSDKTGYSESDYSI